MKMTKTILGLIAIFFLSIQTLKAVDIKCSPQSSGVCNFSVVAYVDIKAALKKQNIKGDFKVFWDFGDGTYEANRRGQDVIAHRYKTAKSYNVTAYFIVEYASEKLAPATCTAVISKVANGQPETVGSFSLKSSLENVGRIRPNDYACVVIAMPANGMITLDYDTKVFEITGVRGNAGVTRNGNILQSNGKQNIFISLRSITFAVSSDKPEPTNFKAKWNANSAVLTFIKQAAYDPNDMRASVRRLKWSEFNGKTDFPIKYTVRFENIGTEEATHVSLKVKIPKGMTYKKKGNEGTYGIAAYGYSTLDVISPYIIKNPDLPICEDTACNYRSMRVREPVADDDPVLFDFHQIRLTAKTKGKENKGYIKYNLFLNKKVEKKTMVSSADIIFDNNGKVITTNAAKVGFKPQPRFSLRVGRSVELPVRSSNKANYEVGLSVSRLRPYGFYFPSEVGISVLPEELKDVNTAIKGIPVRISQQVRHNFMGGFLGVGAGLSANISINNKNENQNTNAAISYTKLLGFLDVNVNALKQRPTAGVRLGFPLNQKFQPVDGSKGQFQIYVAYQF